MSLRSLFESELSKLFHGRFYFRVSCFIFLISFPFLKEEAFSMSVTERFDSLSIFSMVQ